MKFGKLSKGIILTTLGSASIYTGAVFFQNWSDQHQVKIQTERQNRQMVDLHYRIVESLGAPQFKDYDENQNGSLERYELFRFANEWNLFDLKRKDGIDETIVGPQYIPQDSWDISQWWNPMQEVDRNNDGELQPLETRDFATQYNFSHLNKKPQPMGSTTPEIKVGGDGLA